jgi:hypothetical protein
MLVFLRKKSPLPPFKKVSPFGKAGLAGIMLTGLCLLSQVTFADFSISYAKTRLVDNVYLLDAKLNYRLTEVVIEALQHGVSLTLVLPIVVERDRWYLWDESIATLKQSYELKYYALSKLYAIKYLNTSIQETFGSLNAALTRLGNLEGFPLLDKHLIKPTKVYWVYLRVYLDIESLPVPLRPIAHLSSQWHLSSKWFVCSVQP